MQTEESLRLKWLLVLRGKEPITENQIKAFEKDVLTIKFNKK